MSTEAKGKNIQNMSRMDALWQYGTPATIDQMKSIIKRKYENERSRRWGVWLIGESGIGKNHLQEQVAHSIGIEYLWFPCKGIAPEDIRGFPMPVKKLGDDDKEKKYSPDIKGLIDLNKDYMTKEPTYKFQLMESLEKAFEPGWRGIIHFDEFPQASKEVQEVLYMFFYDRRLDDNYLSDGALIVASMNPPTVNDYMLSKIGKAAQDRPSLFKLEPSVKEWLAWGKKYGINQHLLDFVTEHPSVYNKNKGRALHRFSDDLDTFGTIDPKNIPHELKIVAQADIDIDTAGSFAKYLKDVFEISGIDILKGDKKQLNKLEKMMKTEGKTVHLYKIQEEIISTIGEPELHLKDIWTATGFTPEKAWKDVSHNLVLYLIMLKKNDMDAAISLIKKTTDINNELFEDALNTEFIKPANKEIYDEVLRCLKIDIEPTQDPMQQEQAGEGADSK